jgi:hypothetical protein
MSDRAKAVWVAFHDETEKAMAPDGALEALRDVAGKAAENAARVAGVLSIVADPDASIIDADAMVAACELMTWYLAEGLRLTGLHRLSAELRNAMRLLEWLQSKRKREITRTEIMQFGCSPPNESSGRCRLRRPRGTRLCHAARGSKALAMDG